MKHFYLDGSDHEIWNGFCFRILFLFEYEKNELSLLPKFFKEQ
jgi:hypothetical protein